MADVTSQLKDIVQRINTAVRGEDVRDAIIEAINLLKTGDGNAYSLNGHPATYFATQDDMNKILPMDATPTQYSQRPVSSGGIYEVLNDLFTAVDNYINGEATSGTLTDRLEYLFETKKKIRDAINEKGVEIKKTDNVTFRQYADKIKAIENNPNINVSEVTITESNLEYDSAKGEYTGEFTAGDNAAYNPINVEIKPALATITLTDNGTVKASDQNVVGFSEVTVDISESSGSTALTSKSITASDFGDNDTVTFKASDEQKIGYSQVSVDASGLVGEKTLDIDPTAFGEQQVFEAKDDGLHGYSKLTVTLVESEGPFTVKFYVDTTLMQTVTGVPKNGRANYSKDTPTKSGMTFKGWNPSPDKVIKDLDCYAEFEPETEQPGFDTEIPKSWTDIAANGGADIPIGAYKILYYAGFTYDGKTYPGGSLVMQKVYAGENGTTSSWLSMNAIGTTGNTGGSSLSVYNNYSNNENEDANGWEASDLRKFLNGDFITAIANANVESSIVPKSNADILNGIKSVRKYSYSYDQHTSSYIPNAETNDKIWIPNSTEWATLKKDMGVTYTIGKTASGEAVSPPSGYAYTQAMNCILRTTWSFSNSSSYGKTLTMLEAVYNGGSVYDHTVYRYDPNINPPTKCSGMLYRVGFCT